MKNMGLTISGEGLGRKGVVQSHLSFKGTSLGPHRGPYEGDKKRETVTS